MGGGRRWTELRGCDGRFHILVSVTMKHNRHPISLELVGFRHSQTCWIYTYTQKKKKRKKNTNNKTVSNNITVKMDLETCPENEIVRSGK